MKLISRNLRHVGSAVFLSRKFKQRLQGGVSSLLNKEESLHKTRVETCGYGAVVVGDHLQMNYPPKAARAVQHRPH